MSRFAFKERHMLSKKEAAVRRLLFLLCCGGLIAALVAGCEQSGPKMVQVEGKVTYKGKPVPRGYVSFFAKKGNPSMEVPIGPIEDGEYQVKTRTKDGMTPGRYQVAVNAAKQIDPKNPYFTDWLVPEKYSNPKTSKLEVEVVENPQPGAYDIHIEPK
jgi:hypothetical protein